MNRVLPTVSVVAMVKGTERYIWIYSDSFRAQTLKSISRMAKDPDLSLTWYDAATLSERVRANSAGHV